jgi:two-component system, chemotaxis family, sensor kinase CheA
VTDDGAGVDPAQVRRVAKARGLIKDAAIDGLDDIGVLDLLFAPGFSTANTVTAVSGRGVGMDAVRMAVRALGGQAAITSRLGAGSTIRLTLPQMVAITTIVIVRVGEERFGVPIETVVETARIPLRDILAVHGGAAFVLRGRTIPLLQLTDLLHLRPDRHAGPQAASHAKILIVRVGEQVVGVAVDAFEDRSDVLLRPLSGLLAGMPGLLGAALLGDGRLLMVLDMPRLIG